MIPRQAPDERVELQFGAPGYGARHVAIIMDGNGRWAKQRHLPRAVGHKRGVETVREVVRAARHMGLEALTLYATTAPNAGQPKDVSHAMVLPPSGFRVSGGAPVSHAPSS